MVSISAEALQYYVNHIFLPPKLPQEAEDCEHARSAEQGLLRLLLDIIRNSFQCSTGDWKTIERMVECWIKLDSTPSISNSTLRTTLAEIKNIGRLTQL